MQIYQNASLKAYHTFGVDVSCSLLIEVSSVDELISVFKNEEWNALPKLILGKGSNVLFTENYEGIVIVNRLLGVKISEDDSCYYMDVQAGEDWPDLVESMTKQGYCGLENLALIPGCAGTAPIQNIGAYGVEFKDVCDYVDYLDTDSYQVYRLTNQQCQFGYRDSIFKHRLKDNAVVVAIGIKLSKSWVSNRRYGPLKMLPEDCSVIDVFNTICQIRQDKLPDPEKIGSAGSFFKNPVITDAQYQHISSLFPDLVAYPTDAGVKVAAGWLIDQCGFKGFSIGGAQVHPKQALVIINAHHATSQDIIDIAKAIVAKVKEKYGIELEHEVRFLSKDKEVYLTQLN